MKRKPWRRKKLIVDGKVQTRIILQTSLPMFACLLLAIGGEFLYYRLLEAGMFQTDGTIFGMPEQRLGMLLLFVSAATIQLTVSLLTSHKVAGVSYHIRRILHEYRQGNRDARVRLRKSDYQKQLGSDVNEFLDWLEQDDHPLPEKVYSHDSAITPAPEAAPRSAPSASGPNAVPRSAPATAPAREEGER
jgi:hypothetical protein